MYRILSASQDSYITNKIVGGIPCTTSNVGQAGTLDLYKLYNETVVSSSITGSITELTRLLIKFDYDKLTELTGSVLNLNDPGFSCVLKLQDVYGGQTTPSNFNIRLIPVSKSWNEGRGIDVVAYRDLDAVNFITASIVSGVPELWNGEGVSVSGNLGDSNIDLIVSGNLGLGLQDLTVTQFFPRGDENLEMDVTSLVSASLAGLLDNNGFRLSFSDTEETDGTTRFVKRFGTRQAQTSLLHPKMVVVANDKIEDDSGDILFDTPQTIFTYNPVNGGYVNLFSAPGQPVTGSDCLQVQLIASRSIVFYTSSFSISHNATINHLTRSMNVITQSFSGSQFSINGINQPGVYFADIMLSATFDPVLIDFLSGSKQQDFRIRWCSLDGTVTFAETYRTINSPRSAFVNLPERNWVVNITNLKQEYSNKEKARMRVFAQDYNTEMVAYRIPTETRSVIIRSMEWRLLDAFTRKEVIPFHEVGTACSYDSGGMYFDVYMEDLSPMQVYEIELKIKENGKDYIISNQGFRFKVLNR